MAVENVEMQFAQAVAYISTVFSSTVLKFINSARSERIANNFYLCLKSCIRTLHMCVSFYSGVNWTEYTLNAIALANVDSIRTIRPLIWCFQSASQINSTHFYKVH